MASTPRRRRHSTPNRESTHHFARRVPPPAATWHLSRHQSHHRHNAQNGYGLASPHYKRFLEKGSLRMRSIRRDREDSNDVMQRPREEAHIQYATLPMQEPTPKRSKSPSASSTLGCWVGERGANGVDDLLALLVSTSIPIPSVCVQINYLSS
jgi:hypothetical protein